MSFVEFKQLYILVQTNLQKKIYFCVYKYAF